MLRLVQFPALNHVWPLSRSFSTAVSITCTLLAPPAVTQLLDSSEQQESSPTVKHGKLYWKSNNSNNWQYCQKLNFCILYCLFLSIPPAVPQNRRSFSTLQSNLHLASYPPNRTSVLPNAASLWINSLLDSCIQAQFSKKREAGGWKLQLALCQSNLAVAFVSAAGYTPSFDQNNPGLWSECRFELDKLGAPSLAQWAFYSLSH